MALFPLNLIICPSYLLAFIDQSKLIGSFIVKVEQLNTPGRYRVQPSPGGAALSESDKLPRNLKGNPSSPLPLAPSALLGGLNNDWRRLTCVRARDAHSEESLLPYWTYWTPQNSERFYPLDGLAEGSKCDGNTITSAQRSRA